MRFKMYKIRKKLYFQLLEVMISIFLVIVCAVPMLHTFVQMHIDQKEIHRINERDHLVQEVHAKLLDDLYQHRISWSEIENKQEREIADSSILERAKKRDYKVTYQFSVDQPKKVVDETNDVLIKLEIKMLDLKNPKKKVPSYHYYIYARTKK